VRRCYGLVVALAACSGQDARTHPGFELICSDTAVAGGKPIAAGLWYLDAPMDAP
jgi:hypothetical protein